MSKSLVPIEVKDLKAGQKFYVEFICDGEVGATFTRAYAVPQDFEKSFSKFHKSANVFVTEEPDEKD